MCAMMHSESRADGSSDSFSLLLFPPAQASNVLTISCCVLIHIYDDDSRSRRCRLRDNWCRGCKLVFWAFEDVIRRELLRKVKAL